MDPSDKDSRKSSSEDEGVEQVKSEGRASKASGYSSDSSISSKSSTSSSSSSGSDRSKRRGSRDSARSSRPNTPPKAESTSRSSLASEKPAEEPTKVTTRRLSVSSTHSHSSQEKLTKIVQQEKQPAKQTSSRRSSTGSTSSKTSSSSSDSEPEKKRVSTTSQSSSKSTTGTAPAVPKVKVMEPKAPSIRSASSVSSSSSSSSNSDSDKAAKRIPSPLPVKAHLDEDSKSQKKVQIAEETSERPKAAHPRSGHVARQSKENDPRPVSTELIIMKVRKPKSAPARSRHLMAESSELVFLKKECDRLEKRLKKTASVTLTKRPKVRPYTPFTWNSLAPYYNTDTLRYLLEMPVAVRKGYATRPTASGMVDPEVSWKMDHCLSPVTPSRPELYRQHYARRTQSAMPRLTSDYNSPLRGQRLPRVNDSRKGRGSRPGSLRSYNA